MNNKIKENMFLYGTETMTTLELLSLLIGNTSANSLYRQIDGNLHSITNMTVEELSQMPTMTDTKASKIKATIELSKRVVVPQYKTRINSSSDLFDLFSLEMASYNKEYFKTVHLNTQMDIISVETVAIGCLDGAFIHPREVFKNAIKNNTAGLICMHNHPSGDAEPSTEDIATTKRLVDVGELIGITVIDHIVFGNGTYTSMKEKRII